MKRWSLLPRADAGEAVLSQIMWHNCFCFHPPLYSKFLKGRDWATGVSKPYYLINRHGADTDE